VADVVLGAEDVGDTGEDLRLVLADPKKFGQGEVGQGRVAGEIDEALKADLLRQPVALGLGALVAPDERGAEDVARSIEHDATMHLAGEADGLDLAAGEFALGHGSGDGLAGSAPPVVWVLLGP